MRRRTLLIGGGSSLALAAVGAFSWRRATGSMEDYADYCRHLRAPLQPSGDFTDLIRYATLAANGHNTQPWRFERTDAGLRLKPDFSRRTAVVDPDDHHLFVSLGCAAENLIIAAGASARPSDVIIEETDEFALRFAFASGAARRGALFNAITARQSTRAPYDAQPLSVAELKQLADAVREPGVEMVLITDRSDMNQIRDLVVEGNSQQMADPAFMAELKHWIRFSPREARAMGDGLFSGATGNPSLPRAIGQRAFDLFFDPRAENDKYIRQIDTSAGLAVFVGEKEDLAHWVKVGRACQRFALTATSLNLKHSFINQPVEVGALRSALAGLIGAPGMRPDLVMRFGRGPQLPFSPRRPIEAVRG